MVRRGEGRDAGRRRVGDTGEGMGRGDEGGVEVVKKGVWVREGLGIG